jgi:hypothetical protein
MALRPHIFISISGGAMSSMSARFALTNECPTRVAASG